MQYRKEPYIRIVVALRCSCRKLAAKIQRVMGGIGRIQGGSLIFENPQEVAQALVALSAPEATQRAYSEYAALKGPSGASVSDPLRADQLAAMLSFRSAWIVAQATE